MSPSSLRRRRILLLAALASALTWRARAATPERGGATGARPGGATPTPPRSRHVGINLAGVAYWTTQFPFADLVKNSGGWWEFRKGGFKSGDPGALLLGPNGYPARLEPDQSAALGVAWNDSGHLPGPYVVRWEGEGEIGFPLTPAKVVSRSPGRIVVEVANNMASMCVAIEKTRPENPVRNLRFLWPGTEAMHATQPFNPLFLQRLAPFSTLRFMDWGRTNHSPVALWSQRATTGQLTWAEGVGVPLETMVALANELKAHPWLCVPHAADDDYLRAMATLVKEQLDPMLVATIEYSNEVWNSAFGQARYAVEQARRAGLPVPHNMGSVWCAERTLRIVEAFGQVFGPAHKARWRTVVGGQAVWTQFAEDALAWKDVAKKVDALAIAPYFNGIAEGATVDAVLALSAEQLLEQMLANIRGRTRAMIAANARLAAKHGLRLDAYEAGIGDWAIGFPGDRQDAIAARVGQANASPAMRGVYREYLETWIASGGELLNQYFDIGLGSKWGFWGALERVTQDPATAPKYLALLDAIAAHPLAPR
jgi:hypothetical protein